jgi:hypothetical protein
MKIVPSHALFEALGDLDGEVVAHETRDGVAWLVVEFPGYGTVTLPADQFE